MEMTRVPHGFRILARVVKPGLVLKIGETGEADGDVTGGIRQGRVFQIGDDETDISLLVEASVTTIISSAKSSSYKIPFHADPLEEKGNQTPCTASGIENGLSPLPSGKRRNKRSKSRAGRS
jgi:hypothetical protein